MESRETLFENTDRATARLLAKLEEIASPEDTLIVYASDNGSYRNDRTGNLRGSKGQNWEGGIRVPGIFYWPGTITAGRVDNEPAGVVDVLPTVCGLLGIAKPKDRHLEGSDLTPLLTGRQETFERHQPLFWHLQKSRPIVALRDGNYSLVNLRPGRAARSGQHEPPHRNQGRKDRQPDVPVGRRKAGVECRRRVRASLRRRLIPDLAQISHFALENAHSPASQHRMPARNSSTAVLSSRFEMIRFDKTRRLPTNGKSGESVNQRAVSVRRFVEC